MLSEPGKLLKFNNVLNIVTLILEKKMKKKVLIILAICSIASVASANLLVNGDFSDITGAGWNAWNGTAVVNQDNAGAPLPLLTPGDVAYANYAGKAWGNWAYPWTNAGFSQVLPATAGDVYTLSGLVMHLSSDAMVGDTFAVIKLVFQDALGAELYGQDVVQVDATSLTDTWIPGSLTLTAPAGTTQVEALFLHFQPSGVGAGAAFVDNMTLVPEPMTLVLLGMGGLLLRKRK